MPKSQNHFKFADVAVLSRKTDDHFLKEIDKMINWLPIENELSQNYLKGLRTDGRPAYPALLLFKICLLQKWFRLNSRNMTIFLNNYIGVSQFLHISLEDSLPCYTTIAKFRIELKKKGVYQRLVDVFESQAQSQNFKIVNGAFSLPALIKQSDVKKF